MCIYFNHIDWHLILMKEFLFVSLGKELSHLLPRFDGTVLNRSLVDDINELVSKSQD